MNRLGEPQRRGTLYPLALVSLLNASWKESDGDHCNVWVFLDEIADDAHFRL